MELAHQNFFSSAIAASRQAHATWEHKVEQVNSVIENLKSVVETTTQQSSGFRIIAVQETENFLTQPIQTWLEDHRMIAWAIAHPLLAFGGLLVMVLMFGGLLRAIARLTEQVWILLLKAPLKLGKWLLSLVSRAFRQTTAPKSLPVSTYIGDRKERLHDILNQLEAIRQEQDELLKEVKSIIALKE
jgi:hypothetical protein